MTDKVGCPVKELPPIHADVYENLQESINALANKYRIAILLELDKYGELCACDLEPVLNLSQSSVTLHLQKLYHTGFLKKTEKGKYTYYSMNKNYSYVLTFLKELGDFYKLEETAQR